MLIPVLSLALSFCGYCQIYHFSQYSLYAILGYSNTPRSKSILCIHTAITKFRVLVFVIIDHNNTGKETTNSN